MLVGVATLANPIFKLHSRIDLMEYRLSESEKRFEKLVARIHELEK